MKVDRVQGKSRPGSANIPASGYKVQVEDIAVWCATFPGIFLIFTWS